LAAARAAPGQAALVAAVASAIAIAARATKTLAQR
jgi:hypothetical protein